MNVEVWYGKSQISFLPPTPSTFANLLYYDISAVSIHIFPISKSKGDLSANLVQYYQIILTNSAIVLRCCIILSNIDEHRSKRLNAQICYSRKIGIYFVVSR